MSASDTRVEAANRALFGGQAATPGRRAQDAANVSKRDLEFQKNRETAERAQAAKTSKLRALRLAREAEDEERKRNETPAPKAKRKTSSKAVPKGD